MRAGRFAPRSDDRASAWIETLGLAASARASDATSGGIRHLPGGRLLGGLALVAIWIGASKHWLQGGDIAFPVGFGVGMLVYAGILRLRTGTFRDAAVTAPADSG